jgi:hypothetical protein
MTLSSPSITRDDTTRDGVAFCARYALGPNRLHLCGPDMSQEVLAYINAGVTDTGLTSIITKFKTLFPYLQKIADANHIKDPFDIHVVEAYWLGNKLLDHISPKKFYRHLVDIDLPRRSSSQTMDHLKDKLAHGALMHHSFHVLNIWRRTGHHPVDHTLDSLDKCLISWGKITAVSGPVLTIARQPLVIHQNKLALGTAVIQQIIRPFTAHTTFDRVRINDTISLHWDTPCEILSARQLANLKKYTAQSIILANQTL